MHSYHQCPSLYLSYYLQSKLAKSKGTSHQGGNLHIGIDWICIARVRASCAGYQQLRVQDLRVHTLVVKVRVYRDIIGLVRVEKDMDRKGSFSRVAYVDVVTIRSWRLKLYSNSLSNLNAETKGFKRLLCSLPRLTSHQLEVASPLSHFSMEVHLTAHADRTSRHPSNFHVTNSLTVPVSMGRLANWVALVIPRRALRNGRLSPEILAPFSSVSTVCKIISCSNSSDFCKECLVSKLDRFLEAQ
jgi:hypothetical protein